MAILKQKMHHFSLFYPKAMRNKLKHGTRTKILSNEATWFLFKVMQYLLLFQSYG